MVEDINMHVYLQGHIQVVGVVYRDICTKFGLKVPRTKWGTPNMVQNDQAKIQTDIRLILKETGPSCSQASRGSRTTQGKAGDREDLFYA